MASRYWVGGTATWDATAGTKWALTSGGAGGQAVPGVGDDVFFDANSGAVTVTNSAAKSINSIDFNGFTGTFNWTSGAMTINGAGVVRFSAGMTMSTAQNLSLVNTSGTITLTTNGKTLAGITRSGVGGTLLLADAVSMTSLTLSGGTIDTANFNITMAGSLTSSGSSTRVLTLGTSVLTMTGTGGVNLSGSGATYNTSGATVNFTSTASGTRSWVGTGSATGALFALVTLPNVTTSCLFSASNLYTTDLTVGSGWVLEISGATFVNPPTMIGTADHPIYLDTQNAPGTQSTITMASGTMNGDYLILRDIQATGGGTFNATNSVDFGNNSGWNITPPAGGGGLRAFATAA